MTRTAAPKPSHTVFIESLNDCGGTEWSREVRAASRPAAMRKAWRVVADCGATRDEARVDKGEAFTTLTLGGAA